MLNQHTETIARLYRRVRPRCALQTLFWVPLTPRGIDISNLNVLGVVVIWAPPKNGFPDALLHWIGAVLQSARSLMSRTASVSAMDSVPQKDLGVAEPVFSSAVYSFNRTRSGKCYDSIGQLLVLIVSDAWSFASRGRTSRMSNRG